MNDCKGGRIRVVIADDHPVIRAGMRRILEIAPDIELVGEACDGDQALALALELVPDVLLLDVEMPGLNGIEVAGRLSKTGAGIKVLVLSMYDSPHHIAALLSKGVSGYLLKDEAPEFLLEAVRGVACGQDGWISRQVAAQVSRWFSGEAEEDPFWSDRKNDILRLVVEGKTNKEISHFLGISDKTVERHLREIFVRLGVSSRTEAAVLALKENLV